MVWACDSPQELDGNDFGEWTKPNVAETSRMVANKVIVDMWVRGRLISKFNQGVELGLVMFVPPPAQTQAVNSDVAVVDRPGWGRSG
jgi:hypothetical protein